MVEQQYNSLFVYFIFTPALLSLVTSALLLVNYYFLSSHLRGYTYHSLSATLALFDLIQQIGTVLSVRFLFSADEDKCPFREYLFLFGSFCKTLTVLFISATICYVIHFSKIPRVEFLRRWAVGLGLFTLLCFTLMPIYKASATLCNDPTAGNFNLKTVDKHSSTSFSLLYVLPVAFCYFTNVALIINTAVRLRTMFNSALFKLLLRLLPGPVIFTIALLPAASFQITVLMTDKESLILKLFALLGVNLSGALYAIFYFYELYRDKMLFNERASRATSGGGGDRTRLRSDDMDSTTVFNTTELSTMRHSLDSKDSSSVEFKVKRGEVSMDPSGMMSSMRSTPTFSSNETWK